MAEKVTRELDTPCVAVDLDRLEANLQRTAALASAANIGLRPHTKTHKSVQISRRQLELGAVGITVAKLGEAEVMAEAGIADIVIAYPIVGESKLKRLERLLRRIRVAVSTDNYEVAAALSELGERLGRRIPLYIDVNTGLNRCGMEPGPETAELVQAISGLPGVSVAALMTHAGHAYAESDREGARRVAREEALALLETAELIRGQGAPAPGISVGSTPTSKFAGETPGVTEMRPGAYVFGDCSQLFAGLIEEEECALRVYATVVSTPRPGTAIIDAGSKTLSSDLCKHRAGYGYIPAIPDAVISSLSEEHGIVTLPPGAYLQIGDIVALIPNHCCTVVNLHDRLTGMQAGRPVSTIEVDARGRVR
ncbi:alanine racemase [Paenibacillus sp. IB182496]|uniref:Alanine racemase n=1 Tax=Paenibacillus sabuli TaxID=2772509 RepID=A0A927BZS6_9BACL|nr:alanine racemase [Paenibacillus sabuli]MBD2848288.1 alanine racemase [Paenibacillus sabuli]